MGLVHILIRWFETVVGHCQDRLHSNSISLDYSFSNRLGIDLSGNSCYNNFRIMSVHQSD